MSERIQALEQKVIDTEDFYDPNLKSPNVVASLVEISSTQEPYTDSKNN